MGWAIKVSASAERSLQRVPEKAAAAVVEFMLGPLCADPIRVGAPLRRELTGYYAARRGAYRIVYRLDSASRTVLVLRIEHRAQVYRPR